MYARRITFVFSTNSHLLLYDVYANIHCGVRVATHRRQHAAHCGYYLLTSLYSDDTVPEVTDKYLNSLRKGGESFQTVCVVGKQPVYASLLRAVAIAAHLCSHTTEPPIQPAFE